MAATAELGKAARRDVPRSSHARFEPSPDRVDPVVILRREARRRIPELVPIRHGRMLSSPFAFLRGAAAIMAGDLAHTPATGLQAQLCGDAHLANFGGFAAPDRTLVFDVNDFDETLPGPWEWDVKRLAASIEVAARENGLAGRDAVLTAMHTYREAIRGFAGMRTLDVWYARLEVEAMLARYSEGTAEKAIEKARGKDNLRAFAKLTHEVGGRPRIVSDPPLIVPIEELVPGGDASLPEASLQQILLAYRASLPDDRRRLLDGYEPVHFARKVVGVGSVGTDAWIVLLIGRDAGDPLFLQVKEAQRSVLEPFAGHTAYTSAGRRVVEGQRLMQAASDILLGWLHGRRGIDGRRRDYYVRQLWDAKGSARIDALAPDDFASYTGVCGWTLARAHARSGDRTAIAAYLGRGDRFDRALADFAHAYADQTERDHAALVQAVKRGRLPAETGL
ncbi:DUF2252 domain-containing protein [Candidatus Solirubrobacter pratensis]|uniref:DUF2252 domain-containing protein n=1 Tax=Candidatus Solirubrobacter pratensis TaxID=1298857 RepID=UPI00041E38C8|nr:DUF2252 domain-containing protein [Candidatus Solirubrobacter pratensis]